eukprot:tig00000806_g4345.t1
MRGTEAPAAIGGEADELGTLDEAFAVAASRCAEVFRSAVRRAEAAEVENKTLKRKVAEQEDELNELRELKRRLIALEDPHPAAAASSQDALLQPRPFQASPVPENAGAPRVAATAEARAAPLGDITNQPPGGRRRDHEKRTATVAAAQAAPPPPVAPQAARVAPPPLAASEPAGMLDALPDAILGDALRALGLSECWPMRRVCRRWKRVVEETDWSSVALYLKGVEGCDAALERFEERKLRLSSGASVSLQLEFDNIWEMHKKMDDSIVEERVWAASAAARRLLDVIAHKHTGPAGPREVAVELVCTQWFALELKHLGDNFLPAYVIGVLEALRPADGSAPAAASALESLAIGLATGGDAGFQKFHHNDDKGLPWPSAVDLRAALAPFGKLRSLTLGFNSADAGASPEAAASIAAACPRLRSLGFAPQKESVDRVLAALAPLAHLEDLGVMRSVFSEAGLAALADGAAGKSLREIPFSASTSLCKRREQPRALQWSQTGCATCSFRGPVLLALSRMPKLESVGPLMMSSTLGPDEVRELGRIASLRKLSLRFHGYGIEADSGNPAILRALGDALSSLPCLEEVDLGLQNHVGFPDDVVAFLGGAGVRRALTDFILVHEDDRPLAEAEAEAIVALPALRRLHVNYAARFPDRPGPFEARPFEVLRGLRPEVEVRVNVKHSFDREEAKGVERAKAAINASFAGRYPAVVAQS